MFIEKIPAESKKAYIQKLVDRYNTDARGLPKNDHSVLSLVKGTEWSGDILKQRGLDQRIAELEQRNVYFRIYQNYDRDGWKCTSHEYAVIAAFGDASVKTYKTSVGSQCYLANNIENTLEFLYKNREHVFAENPLATNDTYIKEFMLPNLQAIDEQQGTHLVEDYKNALAEKFVKKQQFIMENLQKRQMNLGLEK